MRFVVTELGLLEVILPGASLNLPIPVRPLRSLLESGKSSADLASVMEFVGAKILE